jgi:hypothetical protein
LTSSISTLAPSSTFRHAATGSMIFVNSEVYLQVNIGAFACGCRHCKLPP